MAKKKNPCKFILLKTGEELNFDQARDFLFKNYDFNTKTLKSESYAVQVEEPSGVPVQPKEGVGRTMAEGAPQAKPEVVAEKEEKRKQEELKKSALSQGEDVENLIHVEDIFKNKYEPKNYPSPFSKQGKDLIDKNKAKIIEESINVEDIVPTQVSLEKDNIGKLKDENAKLPILIKEGDKFYVLDGHHRIATEIQNGKTTIKARVFPAEKGKVEEKVAAPLKDVESTAKALEEIQKENVDKFVNDFSNIDIPFRQENIQAEMDSEVKKQIFPNKKTRIKYAETIYSAVVRSSNFPKILSEAYHADKAAGKETELTKAVEELLTPTEYEKATKEPTMLEGVRDGRPEEKGREVSPELRAEEEAKREEEVKADQEKAKTIEAGKKLADKIRGLKIKTPGAQINIAGIPAALYNTAIETIATAIETGATLKAAIDSAIKKHNLNKQKDFNRDEFIKSLEDATELKYEEELEVIAKSGEERIESEKKAAKETVKAQKKAAEEVKTKLTADADSGDMIDRLFKKVGEKTEKKMPPNVMQPISKTKESAFPKEVQQRMDEARVKPQQENWFTKAATRLRNFGLGFSRMYVELDPKKYGQVIDILRTLKNADQRAKELAERHMQNILGDLDNNQKAIFQDYVIASDMLGSIEDGLYETDLEWSDRSGPFGFESFQEVRDAVAKLEQKLNEDSKIKEAVDRRNEFINAMWETSKKAGLVSGEQVGSGRSYFHRQVLKFQEENNASAAILKSSARRKKLSQFKKRKGSTMDYYTNFPEVEAGVVMSTAFEIIKRQEINSIEQIYKPIYDKFKTEASEKAQKAIDQVKSEFGEDSKEYQTALDNQKDLEDKFLLDLMGDEYTIYFPDGKNSLFKTEVITGDAAEKAIEMITDGYVESGIDNLTDGIKPAIMMMKGRRMFIPNDVANVFDRLGAAKAGQEPAIELFKDFVSGSTKIFKKMALLSPFRIIKYVYGNFAGDADKIAATDRRIVARVPDAIRMIVDARKNNKYDPIYDLAIKYGVIGSGSKIEIGDVSAADWSKFAMDKKADIQDLVRKAMENMGGIKWSVEKYFDIVGGIASTREDVFRLAAFIRALEKTKKGEQFYWFSRKTEVDQITNPERKAAKIAREIFGDYGAISQNGEFMAKYLMPFYRFRETNIRAYKNFIFNNFDTKEGKEQILKYGVAKGVTKVATKAAIYSAQMALFTAAVYAWNKIMFPDEEDELRSGGDQSFHIILGRRADGSVRVLRTQGTLNAFMESLGLTGIIQLYKDYENKDVTMADVAKEPSKAFANEFYQGLTPYIKIPFELASGKSRFPNLFRPRTIRDNTEYLFSAMSLRVPYEMLSGKPTLKKDYADLFLTSSMNPKEIAYYQAVNKINEDIGSLGLSVIPGGSILAKTKEQKSEALWRYKMNVKFGNTEEAEKDLIKYYQLGGTPQTLKQTVKALNPIGNYSKFMQSYIQNRIKGAEIDFSKTQKVGEKVKIFIKNRRYIVAPEEIEYAKSISKKDIKMFDMAIKYYEETYKKKK